MKTAQICGEQLLYLINDILGKHVYGNVTYNLKDMTKIAENKLRLDVSEFSIREIVEESVRIVSISAAQKKLTLDYSIDSQLPLFIVGDPSRLSIFSTFFRCISNVFLGQILVNLFSNSIKFTYNGTIHLQVDLIKFLTTESRLYTEIKFCVKDSGIGIPKELQSNIFQPFYQTDSSVSRKYGGSGKNKKIKNKNKYKIKIINNKIKNINA